jgi:hypothetical protein
MRSRKHLLAAAVLAALAAGGARAEEIAFTFTGAVNDPTDPFARTPFLVSFDVNTLDPANTLQDTFANGLLQTISVSVVATNFDATLDGVPIAQNAAGSMSFMGRDGIGEPGSGAFWGPGLGVSGGGVNLVDVPQFGVGSASEAAITGSNDPLGLLLSGSWYGSDDPALLFVNGQLISTDVTFLGVDPPIANVPEPGPLGLFALGLLFIFRRHCSVCRVPLYIRERFDGTCVACRVRLRRRQLREALYREAQQHTHRRATPMGRR